MKKQVKKDPSVKLGGGSFNIDYVKSFESKEIFVNDELIRSRVSFTKDIDDYLGKIWDDCHKEDQLKKSEKVSEKISEVSEVSAPEAPEVKKVSTNKKATSKKE